MKNFAQRSTFVQQISSLRFKIKTCSKKRISKLICRQPFISFESKVLTKTVFPFTNLIHFLIHGFSIDLMLTIICILMRKLTERNLAVWSIIYAANQYLSNFYFIVYTCNSMVLLLSKMSSRFSHLFRIERSKYLKNLVYQSGSRFNDTPFIRTFQFIYCFYTSQRISWLSSIFHENVFDA